LDKKLLKLAKMWMLQPKMHAIQKLTRANVGAFLCDMDSIERAANADNFNMVFDWTKHSILN
jgi:hypothetical protein